MKKIKQFRYYGRNNELNFPSEVMTFDNLVNHNIFVGHNFITQIGIQASPGVVFSLNDNEHFPIMIGDTGIYELDLQDRGYIDSIKFNPNFLPNYAGERLIIDIIYDEEGSAQ